MESTSMNTASTSSSMEASLDRPARVQEAIANAMDLVRTYSERDPYDGDSENPWTNPQAMLEKLEQARQEITKAREAHYSSDGSSNNVIDDSDFRAAYMDMVTNAFADVLEDMRKNGEEDLDVDILVDCLQSGMDFLSSEDKELLLVDYGDNDDMVDDETPTPHERRRIQLGLNTTVC